MGVKVNAKQNIRAVTSNDMITAQGLEKISLKARKLLYVAISQCRQDDAEFFEYTISIKDFSALMDISPTNVYRCADELTDELMSGFIKVAQEKGFRKYALFSICAYKNEALTFKLNPDMTRFLLGLKGDFSKPLLQDFLKMNSPYSMAIWHLMQREMKSKKPGITGTIEFDLSLEELRKVTGTKDKLKQIVNFKDRVLDKAIREIDDNCGVKITYTNIKEGRSVVGFHFTAVGSRHIDIEKIPQKYKNKARIMQLERESIERKLTDEEREELFQLKQLDEIQSELIF